MEPRLFHRLFSLVPLLVQILVVTCISSEIIVDDNSFDAVEAKYESAMVTQHTPVDRRKRSVSTFEQPDTYTEGYEFPDKMSFVIQAMGQYHVLNFTRNTYARNQIVLSDENGEIKTSSAFRFGVYYSKESSASVLVECHEGICSLDGSVEIDGILVKIEQDYTSADFRSHTIRKRQLPSFEQMKTLLYEATAPGERPTNVNAHHLRRRRSVIPDCDIIEVKALVDDTIWEHYKDRFGGDESRATDEIEKYFRSTFAEVDFRLKCLTNYFTDINNCGTNCLRVILVAIEISKTSSWTDGNMRCENSPDGSYGCFVKGINGLNKCGWYNTQMSGHATLWDHLMCFTKENIIMQDSGQWTDYYRTVAWRPSMCNSNKKYRTSITEARGGAVDIAAAHSLLHALNGYNDRDKSCARNEFYLMKEHLSLKTNNPAFWGQNWYLSGCAANDVCNYIKGLNNANNNCMRVSGSFDEDEWKEWEKTPFRGEIYSADQQCKEKWGNDSVQCDPTGEGNLFPEFMCSRHIWCTRNYSCVCQVRISSGTPCGKAKTCQKGQCKPKPDIPLGGTCDCHSQCANENAVCDAKTCTCVCADGYYDNNGDDVDGGNCTEKVPNNGPCQEDRQCLDPNAMCMNGTCQCRPVYFNRNGTCVEQSCLGGICNSTEQCKGENVECSTDRNTCVCERGFFVSDEGQCVRVNGTLCDPCILNPDSCTQRDTECSARGFCECANDTVAIDGECYGTRVGQRCTNVLNTCSDDNAICNGTICDCIDGFVWNGTHCVGNDLCDPCDPSISTCVCSLETYRCICPPNRVQIGDACYGTRVNESCTTELNTCVDNHAFCNGTICDCREGFIWNGSICVGSDPCDPCDPSTNPCQSPFVCGPDSYVCECPSDKVQIHGQCFGTRVTEECTTVVNTCVDNYAECNGTICNCISGFTWNGSICVGPDVCDPCDPATPSCDSSLVCSATTYRCECPSNQVQIGDNCYGTRVTEECTNALNTCADDNAKCNGTICDCTTGFTWNGSRCVGPNLCDPCDPSTSSCDSSLVCNSDTYRCECPPDQVQIGDECYGTRVTEACTTVVDTCTDKYAECNGTVCNCIFGFTWNGSKCVGPDLCNPCDPSISSCDSNLVCSSDSYRCECPPGQVQIVDACYGRHVTEPCTTSLNTCIDDNAECNGTICNCITGFTWNGSVCVGPNLCDPCDPSSSSCDSSLVCNSDTYRCECPPNQVQIGDACYGTFVTEVCTSVLDTCADNNAECNGTICDCVAGFQWNGSSCVGPNLCDPCDPSTSSCDSSLECSSETYRCECPPDQVQIGDACYGTRVTERCTTTLDTCIDHNADCNGTVCDCVSGFTWNGSRCVGSNLCDPCDPSISSCGVLLVCSSDTYRCECPPGQVQVGDNCYGTLVTEVCTSFLDTCTDNNAECNGTICDCVSGFTWNGSRCVGHNLCDPCDPSISSCDSSLMCSPDTYRCECPDGQVQIGDACYGTRVTESCTSALPTCSDNNAECNGTTCVCVSMFIWNGSICVGPDLCDPCDPSTPSCGNAFECSSDTYRCECPPDQVQIGDACYGTRVTERCTNAIDTCTDKRADCNGTVCDCITGYVWNGSICVGTDLCDPCDTSAQPCGPGLVCSPDSYKCKCPTDEVQIGDTCYGTRVTESCTAILNTCTDHNAECNGTVCNCLSGFTWNGSVCVGPDLCDPCDPSINSCDSSLVCSSVTYRCECPPGQVQIGDACYGTLVTQVCTTILNTCTDNNAECNGTVCNCFAGFIWNGSVCVGTDLCDPCDPSTSLCDSTLVCSSDTYRCECPSGLVQIGDMCYGTRVTEPCTTLTNTCTDDNAGCNGTVCDCLAGYTWNGSICVGSGLWDPCDPSSDTCDDNLVCNPATYRCECPQNEVQIEDACYGTVVTEECTQTLDTCVDNNAECNGTICNCITGFIWNGSICVGPNLCDHCDPSISSCDSSFVCSADTYRCECPTNQVQIGDACFGTRVTETCTSVPSTCSDDNAECNGTICNCISGFEWNGTRCVGPGLCDPCDPGTSSCRIGLVCSHDTYRCECPSNQVQIGDNCYGTRVTEMCTPNLSTCTDDKAECNGTICDCIEGFTWNGFLCVGTNLGDPCSSDDPCTPPFVCSNQSICVCAIPFVQIGDNCYGRRVSEVCTPMLDSCIDKNADCNGTVCDCIPGFSWNGSICGGPDLCDPCDPDAATCNSDLVCSTDTYRCECPPTQVQVGDACYGTRVSEVCTSVINTCTDDNADCNGTVCNCVSGFTWNGSICVGEDLCDPCDPAMSSCSSPLVCSSDTYRCECPPGQVQIGDACYGTRINESCTTQLDTCTDDNAGCHTTICACNMGFTWNGSVCVGTDLCDPCDPSDSTCSSPLVCNPDSSTCDCPPNQVQVEGSCYGTLVTESCTSIVDTCTDDNAICNGTVCDCVPGFTWNGSVCVGPDLCDTCDPAISSCQSPLVCSFDTYRCECPTGQVTIGDACYGTRVTESCTQSLNTCSDDNAECNGTICNCVSGFAWNGSRCIGQGLCDPCDPLISTCASHLVCSSDTYRCECPPEQVQIGDMCYGTRVTEACTSSLDTCTDKHAECNGTVCNCESGFTWNGSICVGRDLCDQCDPAISSCGTGLVCSSDTYKCECPPDQVQIGDACFGTRVTDICTTSLNTCIDDRATCNGTICNCMPGFAWNGSICVGTDLCDPCDPSSSTCDTSLVCSLDTYRCECPPNQVQNGNECYGTLVTEPCTSTLDTCIDKNADCNGTICNCISGFTWNGTRCVGGNLCDPCDASTLPCVSGLVCSSDTYKCECPPAQIQIGDSCYGTHVTEVCTSNVDTCTDDNAMCNGTVCDCISGFTWNGSICVGPGLCDPCDPAISSCGSPLVCSPNTYRCECPSNQVQIGDTCYGTRVTEDCTTDTNTCIDCFAECNGTVCNCISGYTWNGSRCVGADLCDPCDMSLSTCRLGLVCSPDTYRCECPTNQVQIGNVCYGSRVTESCTSEQDTCVDDNAGCNGTVCDCLSPYTWNGSICVGPNLCDPCDPSTLQCDSDLVCNTDSYRCECPPGHVQIGDFCYGTRVGELCTTTRPTCIDDNAECNGTVCNCKASYISNGSICVGPDLCDPCDPLVLSCQSSLVCSPETYRCECQPSQVQIGEACYGTLVTEQCTTTLNTCSDENAVCNGTICDCVTGFTWNGSRCVGPDLCDPCDPSISSCGSQLVCSSDTYRCECPPGQVQIEDMCYGTHVTERCSSSIDTCIDDNAGCNGTICDCNPGFIWNGSVCVGADICDPCDPSLPSCSSSLICNPTTYSCECPTNQVQVGDKCYGTRVTEPCTTTVDSCTDYYAECNGTICDCIAGFSWNGSRCVGPDLCDPCDPSINSCDSSLVCSPVTYRCECPPGQVQIGDACYGTRVTQACTTVLNTCIDHNAVCNDTVCDCRSGFGWNGSVCVGPDICDPCDPSLSSCRSGLVCSPTSYKCECQPDQVQIGDSCYGRRINESCLASENTCIDDSSRCFGGVCECIPPFTWNATLELCVGINLDDPCDANSCAPGLACGDSSQRCECNTPLVQIDNVCYGTRVGENCTVAQDSCVDDNAGCSGGVCSCNANFTWNGEICVGTQLDDACDNSTVSCLANGLVCGPTGRCECPDGEVQFDNLCYSLICGPCNGDGDCLGNQTCLNSICQCDTNFYLDNCGICQQKIPNDGSCTSDEQCVSNICACSECVAALDDDCCEDCDDIRADIVVITDNAGSNADYTAIKSFALTFVNAFTVSPSAVQIGVVDYSDSVINGNSFDLNDKSNNFEVTVEITTNNRNGIGTRRTHRAINEAKMYFDAAANRDMVPDYALVILGGDSCCSSSLNTAVTNLKSVPGITIYTVDATGNVPSGELQQIASSSSTAFSTGDFATLQNITMQILDNSCVDGLNLPTPTTTTTSAPTTSDDR